MTDYITNGITNAIYNEFGDDYNIYVDSQEQGANEPCFFVYLIDSREDEKTMGRYLQKNLYHITYFPKTEEAARAETGYYEPNKECQDVLRKLTEILRYVEISDGSLIRGTELNGQIADSQLSFYVHYDLYLNRSTPGVAMSTLSENIRKKG